MNLSLEIIYRKAEVSDCYKIAELMNLASGGIIEFLYHDMDKDIGPVGIVERGIRNGQYPYNYNSCIIAELKGTFAGVSYSYPSSYHLLTERARKLIPSDRLYHLRDFFSTRIDNSWFIDSFGVEPLFQGLGIGTRLLELTMEKARKEGFSLLSLMVFQDNEDALRLYRSKGFKEIKKVPLNRHSLIPHDGGCFLMERNLKRD